MKGEVNKKAVAFGVLSGLVVEVEGKKQFSQTRKELTNLIYDALIAAGVDKHDIKPHLIPSYIQMGRMEYLTGKGAYAHHKMGGKKKPEQLDLLGEVGEEVVPEVVIPEGSQFKAVNGEMVEYFKNRQAATAFVTKNGGKEVWEVTKL